MVSISVPMMVHNFNCADRWFKCGLYLM